MKKFLSILLAVFISFSIVSFTVSADGDFSAFTGEGTQESPYMISSTTKLKTLADIVNGGNSCNNLYFKLSDDFNNAAALTTPIGYTQGMSYYSYFEGNFDGNGKTIRLNISNEEISYVGLFGNFSGGTIQNVVTTGTVCGDSYVGGVVGSLSNNSKLCNCASSAIVTGTNQVGGIVGDCAGVCDSCYYFGEGVNGSMNVGGVAGLIYDGKAINCGSLGQITGDEQVGGFVGFCNGTSEIINCYCASVVSGQGNNVGAFCGSYYNVTVQNCYYNPEVYEAWPIGDSKATFKSTAELQGTGILESLNFETDAWKEREDDYPIPAGVIDSIIGGVVVISSSEYEEDAYGNMTIKYSIAPSYTVTIPAEVTLGEDATISVEAVLKKGTALSISIADTLENGFTLETEEGAEISYSVIKGEDIIGTNMSFLNVSADDCVGSATLDFVIIGEQKYAGDYSGTITFAISIIDE